jgi:hypothetical protein
VPESAATQKEQAVPDPFLDLKTQYQAIQAEVQQELNLYSRSW